MGNLYILLTIFEIMILVFCAIHAGKKEERYARIICVFEWGVVLCGLTFLASMICSEQTAVLFFRGIVLALCDWLIILLMSYTEHYTGVFRKESMIVVLMIVYSVIDNILLLINPWTKWVFDLNSQVSGHTLYHFTGTSILYTLHYIYAFTGIVMVLLTFGYMALTSSKFYRFRYWLFFIVVFVSTFFNILFLFSPLKYDISLTAYGIMAILIYYLSLSYIPNALLENTLSLIIRDLNSGIVCFDALGRCIYINDIAKTSYTQDDTEGSAEEKFIAWMQQRTNSEKDFDTFETTRMIDGNKHIFEVHYKRVYDDKKSLVCDYFILTDRTKEITSYEYERYRATHDDLTGLYNRKYFFEETAKMLQKNPSVTYYMVCSNIRDFKLINELFGLNKGNEVLKKQANLMKDLILPGTTYGRLQGDRFALCIPKAMFREDLLLTSIQEMQTSFQNASYHMHICVGIYEITDFSEDISIMCDKANIAGETIKNNYQVSLAYYDHNLLEKSLEEKRIITEFEQAIKKDAFALFLQPQVKKTGVLYGAEALVRWNHETRGLVYPGEFIDVLEKTGLIYKLDQHMWQLSAAQLKRWKDMGRTDLHISVNISAKDFYFVDIYKTFTGLVMQYDISPENLNLEITETALMDQFDKNSKILHDLQEYGFRIEIDDFGSGYSSLNMLKDISADVLKIDMAFLHATANEAKQKSILESIIELAGKLDMCVITEGVENLEQVRMLTAMGSDMFQGYYFSKPIPVADFEEKYHIS